VKANVKVAALVCALGGLAPLALAQTQEHPWLDTQTKIELTAAAGAISADAWTTRSWISQQMACDAQGTCIQPSESNPLAQPFVRNDAGAATLSAASFSGLVLGNWILRKHSLARHAMNWGVAGFETWMAVRNANLHLKTPILYMQPSLSSPGRTP